MSTLQFAVLCSCGASLEPIDSWIADGMPDITTRMSWACPKCENVAICIQMIDTDVDEVVLK